MTQFNRFARVTVGRPGEDGIAITSDDARIQFRVAKSDKPEANSLGVSLYNIGPSVRRLFEDTDNRIFLDTGYAAGDVRQVAVGDISRGLTQAQEPDMVTSAEAGDGLVSIRDSRVSLSYASPVKAERVIRDIAERMGIEVRSNADLSQSYPRGWAYAGAAREALDQVTEKFRLDWSVQSQELQITNRREPATDEVVLVSPQTGMIRSPEPVDDVRDNIGGDKERPGLRVSMLLSPTINPGGRIAIEARDYDRAQYRVVTVEHRGDTRGMDWHTIAEVVELG